MRASMLIAVEGIDGAGKHTLTTALCKHLQQQGKTVAILSFPQYGQSLPAELVEEALHGGHGDLSTSVYAMALLFALDRAEAKTHLEHLLVTNDVVLLDRYVSSNMAYSAARLDQDIHGSVVKWIQNLEYHRFSLPIPDQQILLDIPAKIAQQRAFQRSQQDSNRRQDTYEHDQELQQRTAVVYRQLANAHCDSPWQVIEEHTINEQSMDQYVHTIFKTCH